MFDSSGRISLGCLIPALILLIIGFFVAYIGFYALFHNSLPWENKEAIVQVVPTPQPGVASGSIGTNGANINVPIDSFDPNKAIDWMGGISFAGILGIFIVGATVMILFTNKGQYKLAAFLAITTLIVLEIGTPLGLMALNTVMGTIIAIVAILIIGFVFLSGFFFLGRKNNTFNAGREGITTTSHDRWSSND